MNYKIFTKEDNMRAAPSDEATEQARHDGLMGTKLFLHIERRCVETKKKKVPKPEG